MVALFSSLALGAPPAHGRPVEAEAAGLQAILDEAVAAGLPGVVALIRTPGGRHLAASGVARRQTNTPMRPDAVFRIASNSKAFLGVVAAELHAEGRLDLDAPITRWLPSSITRHITHGSSITPRQLLQHTAGVYDYLGDDGFWDAVDANPSHHWTTLEALAYAYDQPADFPPGQDWAYSNTNYLLAGLVVDAAAGRHHSAEIRARILEPLGLGSTSYEQHEPLAGTLVHGYEDLDGDGRLDDTYAYDQGYGLADGGLISSASDVATFLRAVGRENGLLSAAARHEFFGRMVPTGDGDLYGLGISQFPDSHGSMYGHGGNVAGYSSLMDYFPVRDITVVAFTNGSGEDLDEQFDALETRLVDFAFLQAGAGTPVPAPGHGPLLSILASALVFVAGILRAVPVRKG